MRQGRARARRQPGRQRLPLGPAQPGRRRAGARLRAAGTALAAVSASAAAAAGGGGGADGLANPRTWGLVVRVVPLRCAGAVLRAGSRAGGCGRGHSGADGGVGAALRCVRRLPLRTRLLGSRAEHAAGQAARRGLPYGRSPAAVSVCEAPHAARGRPLGCAGVCGGGPWRAGALRLGHRLPGRWRHCTACSAVFRCQSCSGYGRASRRQRFPQAKERHTGDSACHLLRGGALRVWHVSAAGWRSAEAGLYADTDPCSSLRFFLSEKCSLSSALIHSF